MSEYKRHLLGKEGEDIASKYISKIGYNILARNFRCKQGEIDIIAKDKDEIVFIEVKTRKNKMYGRGVDAVDWLKQKHIYKVSEYFLYSMKLENKPTRYDIIEIYKMEKYYINHIKSVIMI